MTNNITPKSTIRDKEFYEARGQTRMIMVISKKHKDRLVQLSEQYQVSQMGVIETLLDCFAEELHGKALVEKANQQLPIGRPSKNPTKAALTKALKDMTPEQLRKAQELILQLKMSA